MSGPSAIALEVASFCAEGGRTYNEDFLGDGEGTDEVRLFALADGAGGQGGGDVASRTVVAAAQAAFHDAPVFSPATVRRCFAQAELAVVTRQKDHPRLRRMASTLVVLLVSCRQGQALVGSLGDSRCYIFRGDRLVLRSRDHSLVQRLVDAGFYPAEKLRQHRQRNVLYASLGANEEDVEPFVSEEPVTLLPGDGVLLCSDGVWELLEDGQLGGLHAASDSAGAWRDGLLAALGSRMPEGHDNYSAYLLRCRAAEPSDDDTVWPVLAPLPSGG